MRKLALILGCGLGILALASLELNEFWAQEKKVDLLVERRTTKLEVMAALGTNFIYYSKGQASWKDLDWVLAREPPNRMVAVRQRVPKCTSVMLYSTADVMTWIFLDSDERVVDRVVGAQ